MSEKTIEENIENDLRKYGGLFIDILNIDTNFLYSENFLRKWARANNVGKLSNSYFFKRHDIQKLSQDTNNFTKPQNKIKIELKIEKPSLEDSKKILNIKLKDLIERCSNSRELELLNKFKQLPDETEDLFRYKEDLFFNGSFRSKNFYINDETKKYLSNFKIISLNELEELYNFQLQKKETQYMETTIDPYIPRKPDNLNISKDELRKKNILSSWEVAYITNYSVQTINRWAEHYGLQKDSLGYRWTPSDLKRFEIRKFFDKDSYHIHVNKTLYGKRNMNLRGWIYLVELAILIITILFFCCSI